MRDDRRPWPTAPEGKDRVRVIRNPSRRRVVRRARRDPRPKGPAMSSAYRSWLWTTCISCRSWFLPAYAASGNPESKPHNHTRRTAPSNPVSQSPGQHPSIRPPERKPCLALGRGWASHKPERRPHLNSGTCQWWRCGHTRCARRVARHLRAAAPPPWAHAVGGPRGVARFLHSLVPRSDRPRSVGDDGRA